MEADSLDEIEAEILLLIELLKEGLCDEDTLLLMLTDSLGDSLALILGDSEDDGDWDDEMLLLIDLLIDELGL